jgi:predicted small lipoprotein YifL
MTIIAFTIFIHLTLIITACGLKDPFKTLKYW